MGAKPKAFHGVWFALSFMQTLVVAHVYPVASTKRSNTVQILMTHMLIHCREIHMFFFKLTLVETNQASEL